MLYKYNNRKENLQKSLYLKVIISCSIIGLFITLFIWINFRKVLRNSSCIENFTILYIVYNF